MDAHDHADADEHANADANPDANANPDTNDHLNHHADPNSDTDSDQHSWPEGLLPVCRFLLRSNLWHVRWVRRRVWCVLHGWILHLSDAAHPDQQSNGYTYRNHHRHADADGNGYGDTDSDPDRDLDANAKSNRDVSADTHPGGH